MHPLYLRVQSLRSIKELKYSLTLRTLYTNTAKIVAIHCYQFVWFLPVRANCLSAGRELKKKLDSWTDLGWKGVWQLTVALSANN